MRIIIAIDLIGGKCVRLTKGDYASSKIYNDDPLEVARQIRDSGIRFIHLVDLDGARTKRTVNYKVLEEIARITSLDVDFGGGIRSDEDIRRAFEGGASQVTCGSTAVDNPVLFMKWLSFYGPEKIILGADSRNRKISTEGWRVSNDMDIVEFIRDYAAKGVRYTICTDIEKDGMLQGAAASLYREIIASADINLIASGGITTIADIDELENAQCEGVIIGKAIYEGRITLNELGKRC